MKKIHSVAVAAALLALPTLGSAQASTMDKHPMKNIVQVATDAGTFTTLITALKAAGLVDALQGPGPFTVFAPTDAAFAKLPAGTVESLLADPQKLAAILTYHVVPGKAMAGDIVRSKGSAAKTLNGQSLDIAVRGGKVFVNSAQVIKADILASNGVIHVIDTVLLPSAAPAPAGR